MQLYSLADNILDTHKIIRIHLYFVLLNIFLQLENYMYCIYIHI